MEGQGQLQRTHHRYEDDPHHHHSAGLPSVMEGEGEHNHHGEKKSVLTKVKNKAKKIKDKIKHAGHTHEDDDYDYEDDEETVNPSHDVHAAPTVNEPAFISGTALPKQTGLTLGNPTNLPSARDEAFDLPKQTGHSLGNNPTNLPSARDEPVYDDVGTFLANTAADSKMPHDVGGGPVTKPSSLLDDPYIPRIHKTEHSGVRDVGVGLGKVARPVEAERDVGVGLGKVGRPTEAERGVGVGLGKVGRQTEAERDVGGGLGKVGRRVEAPKTDPPPYSPIGSEQRANVAEPMVKIGPLTDLEEDPHRPKTYPGADPPLRYQAKVADPTGQGSEEVDVAPLLHRLDNMHVDDVRHEPNIESDERTYAGSHDQFAPEPMVKQFNPRSFDAEWPESIHRDHFAPEPMIPTSDEQVNLKTFDAERHESVPRDQFAPEEPMIPTSDDQFNPKTFDAEMEDQFAPEEPMIPTSDEQLSPKTFDAERPESMPQDTIAGKISAATSAITTKAASAKDMVASKLGYGGSQTQGGDVQEPRDQEGITDKAASAKDMVASKLGYGGSQTQEGDVQARPQKTTMESVSEYGHKVAEQLAPVYEKAAGAGSAIMSKVQRGGGGGGEVGGVVKEETDKGVSVQNYFVEKFSPGEEDRELSKVITDAIGRKGGDQRSEEAVPVVEKETIRVETVTSDEKAAAGVVDRVKGAVGSWLGKNRGQQGGGEGLEKEITSKLKE